MSNWIKFSDRMPTEADADTGKKVIGKGMGGDWYVTYLADVYRYPDCCADHFWLENVPPLPKPRTLEDAVRDLLRYAEKRWRTVPVSLPVYCAVLFEEMKEILERKETK